MPKLSYKSHQMPSSPIRKLVPFADKAIQRGVKVYHLNIGQPDLHSPKSALEALSTYKENIIAYTHSQGTLAYRTALQNYYANRGIELSVDDFLVTQGASEALLFVLGVIGDHGDEIIIPEPFYANYYGFAQEMDVNVVPILSRIENDFKLPDISSFRDKITHKTKAILICNPGNPTGHQYSKKELLSLQELVLENDLFLIADEVYAEFVYGNETYFSALQLDKIKQHTIVVDSDSKRFSMCGLRIGSIITRNKEVLQQAMKFAQARLSPSSIGQYISTKAHEDPAEYLQAAKEEYHRRRDVLHRELSKIPGVICPKPEGAFYCMAELPIDDSDKFAQWMLEEFQLNKETVMLAPGSGFYSNSHFGKKQVRLAYVLAEKDLVRSCEILREGILAYNKKE